MIGISSHAVERSDELAKILAGLLGSGDVLLFSGDIGSGKTSFVSALARALDALEPVRSPTYTVGHEYALADGRRLAHLDLYRQIGGLDASELGDLEPLLDGELVCIEWPVEIAGWLPAERPVWHVQIEAAGPTDRVFWIDAPDASRARRLADALAAAG